MKIAIKFISNTLYISSSKGIFMQNNVGQTQINPQIQPNVQNQTVPISNIPPVVQNLNSPNQILPNPVQTSQTAVTGTPNNVQVPNYSGVNIQIFNPSVATPGSTPSYNVNAPYYGADYYSKNLAQQPVAQAPAQVPQTPIDKKKTEKKDIIALTDEYIKNLENYLNSKDKEIRLQGAKQVVDRLTEDRSRKDDPALNILIDKMLQDPSEEIKLLALSALDSRLATGDQYAVQILKNMQNSKSGYGQDALLASNILLKMSGKTVSKEFEVKDNKKTVPKKVEEEPEQKVK